MIETRVMDVDLKIATNFLEQEIKPEAGVSGTNRKSSQKIVDEYTAAMLRGEWRLSHQGLAFSPNGVFVDGGHRMRALVQAATTGVTVGGIRMEPQPDISIKFLVSFGVDADAVEVVDVGKRRLPQDFLTMRGEVNVMNLSGILRVAYCYTNVPWKNVASWTEYRITPTVQREFLDKNPLLHEAVYIGSGVRKVVKSSAGGGFWFLLSTLRPDLELERDAFMEGLRTGASLDKGNPILTLRELLSNARENRRRYEVSEELALTIKAFNRWASGGTYNNLMFRQDEPFPRILGTK